MNQDGMRILKIPWQHVSVNYWQLLLIGPFCWILWSSSVRTELYYLFLLLELGQKTLQIHFLKGSNLCCNLKQMEYDKGWVTVTVLGRYIFNQTFSFLKYRLFCRVETWPVVDTVWNQISVLLVDANANYLKHTNGILNHVSQNNNA